MNKEQKIIEKINKKIKREEKGYNKKWKEGFISACEEIKRMFEK